MTRNFTVYFQLLALFIQIMMPAAGVTWPNLKQYEGLASAFIAFMQGAQAIIAHQYNTDGTPQTVAFKEKP